MGSIVTVSKHSTCLDDWLSISGKLSEISLDADINNHLSLWKVSGDGELGAPVKIDLSLSHSLLSAEEVYVVLLVKDSSLPAVAEADTMIFSLLNSVLYNIDDLSVQTCLHHIHVTGYDCFTYAFLGKNAPHRAKLIGLSYACRLQSLVASAKNLCILTSGGVFRNNKLQMGPVLPLCKERTSFMKDISEFHNIHLIAQLLKPLRPKLAILSYKPTLPIPVIARESEQARSSKPPSLKLCLKPYEEVTYEQIAEEQDRGEIRFDIRATARHELKMEKFSNECSEIIEGLYVSGEKIAKNYQALQQHSISEIVNCAGDYCENWHDSKGINYLTFFLKDSQHENIECLFYRVIEFIKNARRRKKNVLVHCIQGISRSVTFIIAYLIYMNGYDYKTAEAFVKKRRGIASPNNGFMVELIQFHKRLYDDFHSLPAPRVFLVSSHSKETPEILTARLLKQPLFDDKKYVGLDSRGMYIVQALDVVYLWVGSKLAEDRLKKYWNYAQQYIKQLQRDEKAPTKIKGISQGNEGREFFALWNLEEPPEPYENAEYNRLFSEGQRAMPGALRKYYEREESKPEQADKLFIYPDSEHGLGVFELDDLAGFCILIKVDGEKLKLFLWRDEDWNADESQEEKFLDRVIELNYDEFDANLIEISEENVEEPSEEFIASFS